MNNLYSKVMHRITISILILILSNNLPAQTSDDYRIDKDIFYYDTENTTITDYMKE
jgi:hypothetical protein